MYRDRYEITIIEIAKENFIRNFVMGITVTIFMGT